MNNCYICTFSTDLKSVSFLYAHKKDVFKVTIMKSNPIQKKKLFMVHSHPGFKLPNCAYQQLKFVWLKVNIYTCCYCVSDKVVFTVVLNHSCCYHGNHRYPKSTFFS